MRKPIIVIGAVLVLIFLAGAIFVATLNPNRYRDTIQAQMENRLKRKVSLGEMNVKIFPLRFQVKDLVIGEDPAFSTQTPFVRAPAVDLSVGLFALIGGSVEIDSLSLERPSVELIRDRQGVWNFSTLGGARTPESGKTEFSLGKLVINDGQVALTDQLDARPRAVYDHIAMTVKDFTVDHPFSLNVSAHLPGAGAEEVKLEGEAGPMARNQPAMTPFHGTFDLKEVNLSSLRQFLSSAALNNTDGSMSGRTDVSNQAGKLSANGQITIANGRVNGRDLGYPIAADYRVLSDSATDVLTIQQANIKLGNTPLSVTGTMNSKTTPAQVAIDVKAVGASMVELAKLAAASGSAFAPGTTVTGTVSADVQVRGAANNPAFNGTATGSNLHVTSKEIAQPVEISAIKLTFTPAEIASDNFNLSSAGATAGVQFKLKEYLSKTPTIDATVRANNASLASVLSMAKAYGVTSLNKISGGGSLSMDIHAAGPLRSLASAEITRVLNGLVTLNLAEVRYQGFDISHQLGGLGGLLGVGSTQDKGYTTIHKVTGNIAIKNGLANTNDLRALLDLGNAAITGTANLVDETLNLKVTAVLSKDMSQKVGGSGVGGYMQTVLPNKTGELVIPATVTGTFQNPKFAPDMQQIAQMKLKGVIPSFSDPQSAVSGIVGGLLGGQQPAAPGQKQPTKSTTQDTINQIQGLFGGKKKTTK